MGGAPVASSKVSFGIAAGDPESHCCVCGGGGDVNRVEELVIKVFDQLGKTKVLAAVTDLLGLAAKKAVGICSKVGGFFLNEAIKIRAPEIVGDLVGVFSGVLPGVAPGASKLVSGLASLANIRSPLRKALLSLVEAMNKAAEASAGLALPIIQIAIKDPRTSITMGKYIKPIWSNSDGSATQLLESSTHAQLAKTLSSRCRTTMEDSGVTNQYNTVVSLVRRQPLWPELERQGMQFPDIVEYTVQQTVAGIFFVMRQQEMSLREELAKVAAPIRNADQSPNATARIGAVFRELWRQRPQSWPTKPSSVPV